MGIGHQLVNTDWFSGLKSTFVYKNYLNDISQLPETADKGDIYQVGSDVYVYLDPVSGFGKFGTDTPDDTKSYEGLKLRTHCDRCGASLDLKHVSKYNTVRCEYCRSIVDIYH